MSGPIPSWTSSDNKVHTIYQEYLKYEMTLWFTAASGNAAIARHIVDKLDDQAIGEMIVMLQTLQTELQNPSVFKVVREDAPKNNQLQLAAA